MATKVGVVGAGGMLQYHAAGFRAAGAEIVAREAGADAAGLAFDALRRATELSASSEGV